jgi:hypothetical protein
MQTTTLSPAIRCLVGSTTGRGPCETCGVLAELHLVESWRPVRHPREYSLGIVALCLSCGERPQPAVAA